jgi:hypothetical protein
MDNLVNRIIGVKESVGWASIWIQTKGTELARFGRVDFPSCRARDIAEAVDKHMEKNLPSVFSLRGRKEGPFEVHVDGKCKGANINYIFIYEIRDGKIRRKLPKLIETVPSYFEWR